MKLSLKAPLIFSMIALGSLPPAIADAQQQITGAGATFPAPLYSKWGEAAKTAIGVELNYQAIGSGGGQNQILNRTVDFGASDAPMAPEKIAAGNLLQVPTIMGAVVVIVNIPRVGLNRLRLPHDLVAQIYAGKISKWNDPALVAANPDLKLPNLAIAPIYRADGSGTTFIWTSYLSAISPDWKANVGAATSVSWPVGSGARGNDGVSATVRNTKGAIGYVESVYATQNKLVTAQLRNKSGHYVAPSLESFQAAAAQADWKGAKNFAVSIINMPGEKSWPIVSPTFIELPKEPKDPTRSANVIKWLTWCYKNGGATAISMHYVPLPSPVQDAALAAIANEIKS
jgi:phosphate transport system substrate-binding protein